MTTTQPGSTQLSPSYKLPIVIALLSLPLLFIQLGIGLFVAFLGLFLLYQTTTIRLIFTATALEVWRQENILKTFPYADWQSWTIFWPPLPILFYFKEINSIHFLPVLFAPNELKEALQTHVSDLSDVSG
ncbi:MAG: Protein of unknown function (DUF3119) [Phormidesmis priestleyi Ana]|uniref:DUF3119 family protein n=1 Tax=Phormidesmis priestleyi Ana TaxID=1666911 RepID=A0A0P8C2T7_9CYAN|nr:MAG: Protein of unknown function (DUF3119) [Phormidesmis priestleyi Ana]